VRAGCLFVAQGPALPAELNQSQVSVAWKDFPSDAACDSWATWQFHQSAQNLVAPPAAPAASSAGPSHGRCSQLAAAIVLGMNGASEAAQEKKDKFGEQEENKITRPVD